MAFDTLASTEVINKTVSALKENGFLAEYLKDRETALERIKELIPAGASVINGASRSLEQIGFVDYLKQDNHGWDNLHAGILAEEDKDKQLKLRKQATLADFYLGSVHAAAQTGELLIASNTGSQLPPLVYSASNVILVVGTQKITGDLDSAMTRLDNHVFPLEDQRMKDVGLGGSYISKVLIYSREQEYLGRKVHILLINEKLGF